VKKCILIFVSIVLAAAVGYVVGFNTGPERERQRSEMKFRVSVGLRLYHALEAGDTNKALGDVRFVLWGDTVGYERAFGVPAGSDRFATRFAEAKTITAQVGPSLVTNAQTLAHDLKALLATNNITIEKQ
jgi:hypothetical protein